MANPGDVISGMQQAEWDNFLTNAYPMLKAQADKLKTLDTDMYNSGIKNANTVIAMSKQAREQQRESMGISLSGQDAEGQNRYDSLTATNAINSAGNQSVDDATQVKTNIASNILGVQTNLKNQALNDASSAARLQSSRQQQGIINKQQAQSNMMSGIGTVAGIGVMIF
ncbi:MAG: hypothetical protein ACRCVV_05830 [Shewanella sp.]